MTMSNPFGSPTPPGAGIDLKTINGALLLITVHALEYEIGTVHGKSDAIRADVAVLDGASSGDEYKDTLLFPKVLQSQLRAHVGGKIIGRLAQGAAKPGQSAPWVLNEATAADIEVGKAYLAGSLTSASSSKPPF
jgi:hypothetical protein